MIPVKSRGKYSIILALAGGFIGGAAYIEYDKSNWYNIEGSTAELQVCFTPPRGCGELIARQIHQAKESIFLQAYGFTSIKIIQQLIAAHQRGVKVYILLDKSNLTDAYSKMRLAQEAGLAIYVDRTSGIAHNKVIVIDKKQVITGSFNFTDSADKYNAENVLLVNNPDLAKKYLDNWYKRFKTIQSYHSNK